MKSEGPDVLWREPGTGAFRSQVLWIGGRNGAACGKLPSQSERTVEIPLRKELREHDSGI